MGYYDWPKILEKYSNAELVKIIRDRRTEDDDKVMAAREALGKRGIDTTDLSQIMESETIVAPEPDENAPVLYSKKVIFAFSVIFSVVFGGILLAMNLYTVNKKKAIAPVILFSVLYTAAATYFLTLFKFRGAFTVIVGIIGAIVLNRFIWDWLIGAETVYHKKSYKIPLIIALCIFVPLLAVFIAGMILSG